MSAVPIEELAERVRQARAVFLDWDGCLAQSGHLLPGAARFLEIAGSRGWVLSNNSTDIADTFEGFLRRAGVDVPAARILLAGEQAIMTAARLWSDRPIHLVASAAMKARARSLGLQIDTQGQASDVVLLMRDTRFSYAKLARAVSAVRRGARLVVSNADRTHPANGGDVVPETGALLAAIVACVDPKRLDLEIIGKPEPRLFQIALEHAGVAPHEAVMIGDNPDTDIAGAERLGLSTIALSPSNGITLQALVSVLDAQPPEVLRDEPDE